MELGHFTLFIILLLGGANKNLISKVDSMVAGRLTEKVAHRNSRGVEKHKDCFYQVYTCVKKRTKKILE